MKNRCFLSTLKKGVNKKYERRHLKNKKGNKKDRLKEPINTKWIVIYIWMKATSQVIRYRKAK